jgi:ATP-dependent DNA helicase RecG
MRGEHRPRRQLLVTVDDGSDTCVLRFFSFYPSQQKALAVGRACARARRGAGRLLGPEMVHPSFKRWPAAPLPTR